jgi:hypothetical protein
VSVDVGMEVSVGVDVAVGMRVGGRVEVGVQVGIEEGSTAGVAVGREAGIVVGWDSDWTHPANSSVSSIRLARCHDRFLLTILLLLSLLSHTQLCRKRSTRANEDGLRMEEIRSKSEGI